MSRPCLVLAAAFALGVPAKTAFAASAAGVIAAHVELKAAVPGGGGRTWADLAALVFPGVKSELEIRRAAAAADPAKTFAEPVYLPERRIADAIAPLRPLAARFKIPEKLPARYFLDGVKFVRVTGDGKPMLAALFGGQKGESVAALALFEAGPQGRLLDLVQVRSDDSTTLMQRPLLALGPMATAFVLVNSHDSHTVAYEEDTLVRVQGGRFAEIGGFSLNQSHIDGDSDLKQTAVMRALPGAHTAHARIEVTVTTTTRDQPEVSAPRRRKPTVTITTARGVWRWNAAAQTYEAQPSALGKLGDWSEGND